MCQHCDTLLADEPTFSAEQREMIFKAADFQGTAMAAMVPLLEDDDIPIVGLILQNITLAIPLTNLLVKSGDIDATHPIVDMVARNVQILGIYGKKALARVTPEPADDPAYP